ncbi:MAG TPA: hypothetical protein VG097_07815 [Gemmata sp.]|jgi:hypothetical protein|nr:hypothetical protein [Gemmata sp.]
MTEAEWLECKDPDEWLESLRWEASGRKARLFGVACCRSFMSFVNFANDLIPKAIDAAERYADGQVSSNKASETAMFIDSRLSEEEIDHLTDEEAILFGSVERMCLSNDIWEDVQGVVNSLPRNYQNAAFLRDIFGNLFRPVILNPVWLTSTVVALAQQMYDSRDFSPLPILADALQDAGCDNEGILNHCRQPGVYVRGCWAVDLLLGKQ